MNRAHIRWWLECSGMMLDAGGSDMGGVDMGGVEDGNSSASVIMIALF